MVIHGGMLNDGQTQACSATCLGAALVHAIEALEHLALLLGRDADTCIGNRQVRMALIIGPTSKRNRATGLVIANSVTGQVINQLVDQAWHTFDHNGLRLAHDGHVRLSGLPAQGAAPPS